MPIPCLPRFRAVFVLLLIFLSFAIAAPGIAQDEPPAPPPGTVRPLPRPIRPPQEPDFPPPVQPPGPITRSQPLSFDASAVRTASIPAGGTYTQSVPVSCAMGATTADLSVSVAPPGVPATISPTRVTTPASATLTFPTTNTTPAGIYTVTITATRVSGPCLSNSATVTIEVTRPVRLEVMPTPQTVRPGTTATYTVLVRRTNFNGAVDLRTSGLPLPFSFSPNPTSGANSILTVNVPDNTNECPPPGGCRFMIRGSIQGGVQVDPVEAQIIVQREIVFLAQPQEVTVKTGETAHFTINIQRFGYTGPVDFIVGPITGPPGTTPVVRVPNMPVAGDSFGVDVETTAAPGIYEVTLTPEPVQPVAGIKLTLVKVRVFAELPFSVSIQAIPPVQVVAPPAPTFFDLIIATMNVAGVEFGGVSGLPSGTVAMPNQTINPTRVNIFTSPLTPAGDYPLVIMGLYLDPQGLQRFAASSPVILRVLGGSQTPVIRLTANPAALPLPSNQSASTTITASRTNCSAPITLVRPALPPEIQDVTFTSTGTDQFQARFTAATVTSQKTFMLSITGQAPGCANVQFQPAQVMVTVQLAAGGTIPLSVVPTLQTVNAGATALYSVQINRGGITAPVQLAVTGVPAGATASFSPNPASGTSAALSIATTAGTPAGSYILNVSGASSGATVTPATATLVVSAPSPGLPEIGGFNPLSGLPGTSVQITGTNLGTATAVAFNGTPAAFTASGPSQLFATVRSSSPPRTARPAARSHARCSDGVAPGVPADSRSAGTRVRVPVTQPGSTSIGITRRRKKRSSRNRLSRTAVRKSALVA